MKMIVITTTILLLIAAFAAASPDESAQTHQTPTPSYPDGWLAIPNKDYGSNSSGVVRAPSAMECANIASKNMNMAKWNSSNNDCIMIPTQPGDQILNFRDVGYTGSINYELLASSVDKVKPAGVVEANSASISDYLQSCENIVEDLIKKEYKCIGYVESATVTLLIKYKSL